MKNQPAFVTEIPLKVSPAQEAALNKRFHAAQQVYNACLGECLRRLDLMRESKAYQAARKMPRGAARGKGELKKQAQARARTFYDLNEKFGFRKYDLQSWAKQFGYSWPGHHLDSQSVKKLSQRAFETTQQHAFGQRGRPKFKRAGAVNSVETITNTQGIIWRKQQVIWNAGRYGQKMVLEAIIDLEDEVLQHGLESPIKYVRLIRRSLNGRLRFYAQLVNEGLPLQRFALGQGTVGLNVGPSALAIVNVEQGYARLLQFCEALQINQKEIRRLQRQIARQRRANNPANYEPDRWQYRPGQKAKLKKGPLKKGPKVWLRSNKQKRLEVRLAELYRRQTAHRKSLHGQLVNQIVSSCDTVKLQKLSYKAFQMMFGRSVGLRAPGMFVERLRRKMKAGGGVIEEFPPFEVKLAQRCHGCGRLVKKPLSQRWHKCECGVVAQRNLYSAFLAACVEDGEFNAPLAHERWSRLGPALRTALDDMQTGDSEDIYPSSFGLGQSRSRSSGTMSDSK